MEEELSEKRKEIGQSWRGQERKKELVIKGKYDQIYAFMKI